MLAAGAVALALALPAASSWQVERHELLPQRTIRTLTALSPSVLIAVVDAAHGDGFDVLALRPGSLDAPVLLLSAPAGATVIDSDTFAVAVGADHFVLRLEPLAMRHVHIPGAPASALSCAARGTACAWRTALADADAPVDGGTEDGAARDSVLVVRDADDAPARTLFAHACSSCAPPRLSARGTRLSYLGLAVGAAGGAVVVVDGARTRTHGSYATYAAALRREREAEARRYEQAAPGVDGAAVAVDGNDACDTVMRGWLDERRVAVELVTHVDGIGEVPPCPVRPARFALDVVTRARRALPGPTADAWEAGPCSFGVAGVGAIETDCAPAGGTREGQPMPDAVALSERALLLLEQGERQRGYRWRAGTVAGAVEVSGPTIVTFAKREVVAEPVSDLDGGFTTFIETLDDDWHLLQRRPPRAMRPPERDRFIVVRLRAAAQ